MFPYELEPLTKEQKQRIRNGAIAFRFTSEMREWENKTHFDGPCSYYDAWTYGRCVRIPDFNSGRAVIFMAV